MSPPGGIGEDDLARVWVLLLARAGEIPLAAVRRAHVEVLDDLSEVERRDRRGVSERDRVAQIDERVDPRQSAVLPKAAQQCL